jgi:hypothetical protein
VSGGRVVFAWFPVLPRPMFNPHLIACLYH